MRRLLPALLALGTIACATTGGKTLDSPVEPPGKASSFGADTGEGNVVAVQPFMHSNDYASDWLLSAKLENYLEGAKSRGWLTDKTLVVFPEGIGTWLVAVDEEESISQARTVDDVRKLLSQKYWFDYWTQMPFADAQDKGLHTAFRIKATAMLKAYQKLFSKMARDYKITILAGSIVLPDPEVVGGQIEIDPKGKLYSAAFVFGPDGRVLGQAVRKVRPTGVEQTIAVGADPSELPVIETTVGKIGVLLGSDSWYTENYAGLKAKGAELIVVPSLYPIGDGWRSPWEGMGTAIDLPTGVAPEDVGSLPGHDAWLKYGMPAKIGAAGTSIGIAVFMRGRIWDLDTDGQITILKSGKILEGAHLAGPVVVNTWLGSDVAPDSPAPERPAEAPRKDQIETDAPSPSPPPPPPGKRKRGRRGKRRR